MKVSFLSRRLCFHPTLVNLSSHTLLREMLFIVPGGGFLFALLCALDTGCNSVGMGDRKDSGNAVLTGEIL